MGMEGLTESNCQLSPSNVDLLIAYFTPVKTLWSTTDQNWKHIWMRIWKREYVCARGRVLQCFHLTVLLFRCSNAVHCVWFIITRPCIILPVVFELSSLGQNLTSLSAFKNWQTFCPCDPLLYSDILRGIADFWVWLHFPPLHLRCMILFKTLSSFRQNCIQTSLTLVLRAISSGAI